MGIRDWVKGRRSCWAKQFQDLKLSKKMIVMFAVILCFCLLFSISMLQISLRIYDEQLYEKSLQELDFFSQRINEKLQDVENLSYDIALDSAIQQELHHLKEVNYLSAEYSYGVYQFRMMLNNKLMTNDAIKNVTFTDGERIRFTVGESPVLEPGNELVEAMLEECHQAGGAYRAKAPTEEYPYMLSGRDIRSYVDAVSLEYLGSLIFTTDVAGIIEKNKNTLEVESASLCVFSDNGLIYESQNGMYESLPQMDGKNGFQIEKIDGTRYLMCYLQSSKNGWSYVNMFPYSQIFQESQVLRLVSIGGFLVMFLAAVLLLEKLAHMMTRPLEQLTQSMQIVETGDFASARKQLKPEGRKDEIGQISQEFAVMLDQIDTLIHENYEKQILLRDTRLKMLQAQINPHFLYNTLNAIHWMIRSGRNEDAARMILVLGNLLRAAFAKQQYVSLQEELELVKNYIAIQEYRYQRRASFSVETEGDPGPYEVPHMLIQPLVENAVYHGVENSLNPCKVQVLVREETDTVYIEVSDDGPGMQPDELQAARNFTIQPKGNGIGLKNIYERLRLTYEKPEFVIDSQPGKGTAVRIRIPKMRTIDKGEVEKDV